jgi:hypothetical protein
VAVKILAPRSLANGRDIVVVMINGSSEERLDEILRESDSPLLKKMAGMSIIFNDCKSPSLWYPSAAASFMTGLYPSEHGLSYANAHLSIRADTLTEDFASVGYLTCAFVEEYSLLACTGVLQGFEHVIEDSGIDLAKIALSHIALHIGKSSVFGLIEINASTCAGAAGVEKILELILSRLDKRNFFERGIVVVCAPGSRLPREWRDMRSMPAREFLMFVGGDFGVASGKVVLKPTSLVDAGEIVKKAAWGAEFPIRDSVRNGRMVLTEMTLPLDEIPEPNPITAPPYYCRLAWFDDLPFNCYIAPGDRFEFQDEERQSVAVSAEEEAVVRSRYDAFLLGRRIMDNLNIPLAGGPVLDDELAERLGGPWLRNIFRGRRLHAVEHFRLGEAKAVAGFPARATIEFRSALAIDPHFAEASFQLAKAYAAFGRPRAAPYFRTYIERFGGLQGQEANIAEAVKFLEGD